VKKNPEEAKDYFMRFKADFSRIMIEEAAKAYGDGSAQDIRDGSRLGLLDNTDAEDLLETLKGVARKFLYIDEKVQRPFLAGLRIVHGILDQYGELLELSRDDFALLRKAWKSADRKAVQKAKLHTLLPLLVTIIAIAFLIRRSRAGPSYCTTETYPWGAAISSVRCTESRESMERCPGSATRQCIYNVEAATAVLGWLFVTYVPYNAHFVFVDDDIDH